MAFGNVQLVGGATGCADEAKRYWRNVAQHACSLRGENLDAVKRHNAARNSL